MTRMLPFNMTTPRMKLADGEELQSSFPGLRRKGIFGNRFGELVITNQRVSFVKAIMKSGLSARRPTSSAPGRCSKFPRTEVTAEQVQLKKQVAVQLSSGARSEPSWTRSPR